MVLPTPEEVAARARAALTYAGIDIKDSAEKVGITYSTMTRIVSPTNPRGVKTIEELWKIADGCRVPRAFMEHGFNGDAASHDDLQDQITELRSALFEQTAELARHGRAIAALRRADRRGEPQEGDGRG